MMINPTKDDRKSRYRVNRGGDWENGSARVTRVSYRNFNTPTYTDNYLGFRIVKNQ